MVYPKIVLGVVVLLPSVMLRAQTEPVVRAKSAPAIEVRTSVADGDETLAGWLLAGCNNEMEIARLAVRKAHDPQVKLFAQKMLEDHGRLAAELVPFTLPGAKSGGVARVGTEAVAKPKKDERGTVEVTGERATPAKSGFDHLALIRDLSRRCLESQSKMLEAKTGADFDRSFMRAQVATHTQAVIMADVFHDYASSRLRPTLEQLGNTLQTHLEHAVTLCEQCDGAAKVGDQLDDRK